MLEWVGPVPGRRLRAGLVRGQQTTPWNLLIYHKLAIPRTTAVLGARGRNHGWKVEGPKLGSQHWALAPRTRSQALLEVGAGGGGRPSRCGGPGYYPRKICKTQLQIPAFWWLLRSSVGSLGRVYPSKKACEGLNQFQNLNVSAVVVRTKKQSNGNYETILAVKFLAFWKLRPKSWGTNISLVANLKVGDQSPLVLTVVAPMLGARNFTVFCTVVWLLRRRKGV